MLTPWYGPGRPQNRDRECAPGKLGPACPADERPRRPCCAKPTPAHVPGVRPSAGSKAHICLPQVSCPLGPSPRRHGTPATRARHLPHSVVLLALRCPLAIRISTHGRVQRHVLMQTNASASCGDGLLRVIPAPTCTGANRKTNRACRDAIAHTQANTCWGPYQHVVGSPGQVRQALRSQHEVRWQTRSGRRVSPRRTPNGQMGRTSQWHIDFKYITPASCFAYVQHLPSCRTHALASPVVGSTKAHPGPGRMIATSRRRRTCDRAHVASCPACARTARTRAPATNLDRQHMT